MNAKYFRKCSVHILTSYLDSGSFSSIHSFPSSFVFHYPHQPLWRTISLALTLSSSRGPLLTFIYDWPFALWFYLTKMLMLRKWAKFWRCGSRFGPNDSEHSTHFCGDWNVKLVSALFDSTPKSGWLLRANLSCANLNKWNFNMCIDKCARLLPGRLYCHCVWYASNAWSRRSKMAWIEWWTNAYLKSTSKASVKSKTLQAISEC